MKTPLDRRFRRLLADFQRQIADNPEMTNFPSGIVSAEDIGAIDDGVYGSQVNDDRPEFVKEAERGWIRIGRL